MMNSIKNLLLLAFVFLAALGDARAEQGCPPGQIPAQAGGSMTSCGPIPAGYYQQQQTASPRPSGEWIETWGAIASDGGDNLGVSTEKIKKSDAINDAMSKCSALSQKKCSLAFSYKNQCSAIAEPHNGENAISGMLSFAGGPSKEIASGDALSSCRKENSGAECRVIYAACSEPIFKKY
jgi:hypothetical protein